MEEMEVSLVIKLEKTDKIPEGENWVLDYKCTFFLLFHFVSQPCYLICTLRGFSAALVSFLRPYFPAPSGERQANCHPARQLHAPFSTPRQLQTKHIFHSQECRHCSPCSSGIFFRTVTEKWFKARRHP